ncbi:hypothetical protein HYH03_003516 [Edaphochlamys debaryana]|uniref:Uncharacterized protein n=1 Tax=Edaphochlamys debaryana TaxID=47281 RepID=A0A836C4H8_9CHLO|nr:hypothetical protein HYH03_003516 [Edaphochlamys debaryana]|eukprot:KAG2498777.1 hypothetical protein HYH03_003516 [Edaphochlamys debaryana]
MPGRGVAGAARCPGAAHSWSARRVRVFASASPEPSSSGSSAPTATTPSAPSHISDASPLVPHMLALLAALVDRASALANQLGETLAATRPVHLALPLPLAHGYGVGSSSSSGASATSRPVLPASLSPRSVGPNRGSNTYHGVPPPWAEDLQSDDDHLWSGPEALYLPWSYGPHAQEGPSSSTSAAAMTSSAAAAAGSSAGPSATPAGPLGDISSSLAARLVALFLVLQAAAALPKRAASAAMHQAEVARRALPPVHLVPGLVQWTANTAAARAEESLSLALARAAAAASTAAAGAPAAAAAVTGSAAAVAVVGVISAPHLPLLRRARRRMLAAAAALLDELRLLQRGCTTHTLLRFVLYSPSLNPGLRRGLLVRLDVLSRRAAQLALLQDQHDAWIARQPQPPLGLTPAPSHGSGSGSRGAGAGAEEGFGSELKRRPASPLADPGQAAAAFAAAAALPPAKALSARWYRAVLVPELRAVARQLAVEPRDGIPTVPTARKAPTAATSAAPTDAAGVEQPGQFDLRDLYRLIRVVEVAVEDLKLYPAQ